MKKEETSYSGLPDARATGSVQTEVIPVVQEFATVVKETVETGKVHVQKKVHEEQAVINLPIINESYDIERVPVNKTQDTPPPPLRYEGDVIVIPVTKEITIVQKRYEIIEELRITRKLTETPTTQEITLRKEEVQVKRTALNRQNDNNI